MPTNKTTSRERRHLRIRAKMHGTASRPRLVVYKSLVAMYAQLINDDTGKTMAGFSDLKIKSKDKRTVKAKKLGLLVAEKAKELKIESIIFDRAGYKYHGRVKALAEGAREGGLKF